MRTKKRMRLMVGPANFTGKELRSAASCERQAHDEAHAALRRHVLGAHAALVELRHEAHDIEAEPEVALLACSTLGSAQRDHGIEEMRRVRDRRTLVLDLE